MTREYIRQVVPTKVLISRELRRRNFGRLDHKRKAWWTISLLKQVEEERIKSKQFWANALSYARLRLALKCPASTHFANSTQSSTFDRYKLVSSSPRTISWLILIIKIVMILGAVLYATSNQFGKEYSSCTAGDGPPKKIQKTADCNQSHVTALGNFACTNLSQNL